MLSWPDCNFQLLSRVSRRDLFDYYRLISFTCLILFKNHVRFKFLLKLILSYQYFKFQSYNQSEF
jgi:hypothetical protein